MTAASGNKELTLEVLNMNSVRLQIPRRNRPTREEFETEFALPGKPVILTGLTDHWPARKWTPEGLASRFPEAPIELTALGATQEGTVETTLSEYVKYLDEPGSERYYMTSWCFRRDCPELLRDFEVPEYFAEDWLEELPTLNDMMWLFLGPKDSGMAMHQDLGHTAAWNAQVTGSKRWALAPPEQEDNLYEGEVDVFNPDLANFPRLAQAETHEGVVNAGEVLFIPGGWWHQTINLATGFAITANYVDKTNYQKVLDCLEDYGEEELFQQLQAVIKVRA